LLYDLYDNIALGESRCELIQRRCLLLVGLTRAGKSTLFNWINDRPLVGRTGDFNGLNYYLVNDKE
jgi:ABC-type phosphate/phosphonate transport system ATPase subunit